MSDPKRRAIALDIFTRIAYVVEGSPSLPAVARNTLNHLLDGSVRFELAYVEMDRMAQSDRDSRTLTFNLNNGTLMSDPGEEVLDTAAHEINHILNREPKQGTVDQFLNEYRAYYVGEIATGHVPPRAEFIRGALKNLTVDGGSGYKAQNALFKTDRGFQRVVAQIKDAMRANPPTIMTPEEVRLLLRALPGNERSEYLNTVSNLDNH